MAGSIGFSRFFFVSFRGISTSTFLFFCGRCPTLPSVMAVEGPPTSSDGRFWGEEAVATGRAIPASAVSLHFSM